MWAPVPTMGQGLVSSLCWDLLPDSLESVPSAGVQLANALPGFAVSLPQAQQCAARIRDWALSPGLGEPHGA